MGFGQRLVDATNVKQSILCVGIDPIVKNLPKPYQGTSKREIANGVYRFCCDAIEAIAPAAAVVKPNAAYFEVLGRDGYPVCWDVAEYARSRGLIVIEDAKRGDIGKTSDAYAEAHIGSETPFDAVTCSATYFGRDGMEPFALVAKANDKGVFFLDLTSNPGSSDLQKQYTGFLDIPIRGTRPAKQVNKHLWVDAAVLIHRFAEQVAVESEPLTGIGAVVGATHPDEMETARLMMPRSPFLLPGYGSQGATADDATGAFFKLPDGRVAGGVVNSSSGIVFAYRSGGLAKRVAAGEITELQAIGLAARNGRNDLVGALRRRQLVTWEDMA